MQKTIQRILNRPHLSILVLVLFLTLGLIGRELVLAAWTGPPAGVPPAGNVDSPINVSDTAQHKLGKIEVGEVGDTVLNLEVHGYASALTPSAQAHLATRGWVELYHAANPSGGSGGFPIVNSRIIDGIKIDGTSDGTPYTINDTVSKPFVIDESVCEDTDGDGALEHRMVTPFELWPGSSGHFIEWRPNFAFAITTTDGNLGGVTGADALCQAAADAEGIGGEDAIYFAWLSTNSNDDPESRFNKNVGWVNYYDWVNAITNSSYDQTMIATSWADLTDGQIGLGGVPAQNNFTLINGGLMGNVHVWTSVNTGGTVGGANCNGWTSSASSVTGATGSRNSGTNGWTVFSVARTCDQDTHVYCFEQFIQPLADGQPCVSDNGCVSGICGSDIDGDDYFDSDLGHTGTCQPAVKPYTDCCDSDADSNPGHTIYSGGGPNACGSWDWNCNGTVEKEPGDCVYCSSCSGSGSCALCGSTKSVATANCNATRACGETTGYQRCTFRQYTTDSCGYTVKTINTPGGWSDAGVGCTVPYAGYSNFSFGNNSSNKCGCR